MERTSLVWGLPLMKGLLLFCSCDGGTGQGQNWQGLMGHCLAWSACLSVLCVDWMMEGSQRAGLGTSGGYRALEGHCGKISLPFCEKGWERLLRGLWTPVGASTCVLASERVLLSLLSFFPADCRTARNRRRGRRRTHRFHV